MINRRSHWPIIGVDEAADRLGLSPRTIRRLAASHAIGHHKVGAHYRFCDADLAEYMAKTRVPAES